MKDYSFGNFICALRMRRGLSQFQLGTLVGVSNKAVSKWETGAAKPQLSTCRKLAEVLGVSLDELLSCKYQTSASAGKDVFAMSHKLWQQAQNRLTEIYGTNPPAGIVGRFETEKMIIRGSGLIAHFDYLAKLAAYAQEVNSHISLRGEIGNSLIAWIMGATDVNPIEPHYYCNRCKSMEFRNDVRDGWDLPPKRCACGHMMYGDGHRIPCEAALTRLAKSPSFDINVPPELLEAAEGLLREHFSEEAQIVPIRLDGENQQAPNRFIFLGKNDPAPEAFITWETYAKRYRAKIHYTFCVSGMEQAVQELCRRLNRTPDCVDFLSEEVIDAYNRADVPGFLDSSVKPLRPLLEALRPTCFSEILKAEGLQHSTGAWEDNQAEGWAAGEISFDDLIAFREDVYDAVSGKMRDFPYAGNGMAQSIMENARMGRYYQRGMSPETENVLKALQLSPQYIDTLKKVMYLFPRAHSISYLHTEMILMWFCIHEKETWQVLCRQ